MTDIDQRYVAEVVAGLSDAHKIVISEMQREIGIGPTCLSRWYGWPKRAAQKLLRDLEREGVCVFGWLANDEGLLHGKGYWLEAFGMAVKDAVDREWEQSNG